MPTKPRSSGVMADIVAQGQANVQLLEKTFENAPTVEVAIDYVRENPSNPRTHITEASIEEMANAIKQCGDKILQPLLIRPIPRDDHGFRYEVVCGTRRLLGGRRRELKTIPVTIRDLDDETAARFALWENLGREGLHPMDIAESVNKLRIIDRLTWDQIGEQFGFSRQWGWQQQRLAELPPLVRSLVREGSLSMSNAFLIATEAETDEEKEVLAARVVNEKLSYRALQSILKGGSAGSTAPSGQEERKDVFTWSPPAKHKKQRKFARFNKAAEDIVQAYNAGLMTPDYARSLRDLAERILTIADAGSDVKTSLHGGGVQ